jgi:hypothetical protein
MNEELNQKDQAGSIIYNMTIKVDGSIADAWLKWMQEEHIPGVMGTGCFSSYRIVRLLEVDDSEGPTYAVQYQADSKADYNRYMERHVAGFRKQSYDLWGDQFITFNSVMQVVK